jgi:hypothetical protein
MGQYSESRRSCPKGSSGCADTIAALTETDLDRQRSRGISYVILFSVVTRFRRRAFLRQKVGFAMKPCCRPEEST